jgi:hypothetical protein
MSKKCETGEQNPGEFLEKAKQEEKGKSCVENVMVMASHQIHFPLGPFTYYRFFILKLYES